MRRIKYHLLGLSLLLISFPGLSQETPVRTVIQRGHGQVVKSSLTDPSGKYVFTASRDRTIKMWDRESGLEIRTFFGHKHTVNHLVVWSTSKDYKTGEAFIASTSADNTARIWDLDGKEMFRAEAKDYMTSVAISPDGKYLVCGGFDWHIRIYLIQTGEMLKEIKVSPDKGLGYGVNLEFSADGRWLALGEDNQRVRIFSVGDWGQMYDFPIGAGFCGGCVAFVDFLPNGDLVKSAQKGPFQIIKLNHESLDEPVIRELGRNEGTISSIDVSEEGLVLVAGEQFITVLNPETADTIGVLQTDVKEINEARFASDGAGIIVSGNDNMASIYEISSQQLVQQYGGIKNMSTLSGLNYDPSSYWDHYIANWIRQKNKTMLSLDKKELIRGKFGNKIKRWDLISGRIQKEYSQNEKAVLAFDLSLDGELLVSGDGAGRIILYQYETGDTIRQIGKLRELVFDLKFSHDQKRLVASGWDGYLHIWDLENEEKLPIINLENTSVYTVSYTPNDLYLVLGRLDKKLELWEPDTRTKVKDLIGHSDVVSQIRFSEDGSRMLTASWDGTAREWDLSTGMQTWKARAGNKLHSADYSPDGKYIVTAGEDRVIQFWDRKTGELMGILEGHQAPVYKVLFTEGGNKVITTDEDGVTKFWDLEKGQAIYEQIHIGKNDWMVRTPEGYFSATDGARKFIHFNKGNKTYRLDQFFDNFYRPDIESLLTQSRGKRSEKSLADSDLETDLPKVKLAAIEKEKGKEALIGIRVYDQAPGTYSESKPEIQRELRVYHNGKRTGTFILGKKYLEKDGSYKVKMELPLVNGKNVFEAVAAAGIGLETAPSRDQIMVNSGNADAKCYLMAIGINNYQNPKLNLNYARADAQAFVKRFVESSRDLYAEMVVEEIYDSEATRDNISSVFRSWAKKVNINDVFIFYYAGHGTLTEGQFYFVPHESTRLSDEKSLDATAISSVMMQSQFESIKALKQIIIMDACQSGGSVEMLAQRGAPEEKAIAQLSRSAGIHVMASAGSDQFATEFESLGHGVFTYNLLEALAGKADGAPEDEKITIYELKSYLDDRVPSTSQELKGDPQYPYTFSRGQDFPLVIKKR